jgi:hypothetical protein
MGSMSLQIDAKMRGGSPFAEATVQEVRIPKFWVLSGFLLKILSCNDLFTIVTFKLFPTVRPAPNSDGYQWRTPAAIAVSMRKG